MDSLEVFFSKANDDRNQIKTCIQKAKNWKGFGMFPSILSTKGQVLNFKLSFYIIIGFMKCLHYSTEMRLLQMILKWTKVNDGMQKKLYK